jgi:L-ribulokinase
VLIVDVKNGERIAVIEHRYPHGIITEKLPTSKEELPDGWALHHPSDYLTVLKRAIPKLLKDTQIDPDQIIGIGINFCGCSVMPTTSDGTPLALLQDYQDQPHAWPKMWHHTGAQDKAKQLTQLANDRFETFIDRYGGKIDAEWFFPKVWEIYDDNSSLYNAADRIIDASDWVVWQLTGFETRNLSAAGYKALWSKSEGFPLETFFGSMDQHLSNVIDEKMKRDILPVDSRAGELSAEAAKLIGLCPGTPVAAGNLSSQAALPAATISDPGKMALLLGTNFKLLVLSNKEYRVPGMSGMVEDGVIPGLFGYEAKQAGGKNHYDWYIKNAIPGTLEREAKKRKITVFDLLEEKAFTLAPAESGLVALDWWNGNRSILADRNLTGLILGYSIQTTPEEIFRAIIEATAYGTRKIFETFIASGVPINEIIVACDGSMNNNLFLNILANVTRIEIKLAECPYTSALGAAIYASVAAGERHGGYATINEASRKMSRLSEKTYTPNNNDKKTYNRLYSEYTLLHDYFGYGHNNAMKRLNALRSTILEKKRRSI